MRTFEKTSSTLPINSALLAAPPKPVAVSAGTP